MQTFVINYFHITKIRIDYFVLEIRSNKFFFNILANKKTYIIPISAGFLFSMNTQTIPNIFELPIAYWSSPASVEH